MRFSTASLLLVLATAQANNNDRFNYGFSDVDISGGTDYGQQNWGDVSCDDLQVCSGYPDKFLHGKGFSIAGSSSCQWCPENGPQNCGLHRQSPINLERNRGIVGDPMEKECPDWHFMHDREGSCSWNDLQSQFEIARHALNIHMPIQDDGQLACVDSEGLRRFPRMDYSKGFPDWWWLSHTSIQVPSQHTQEGKRYDAEVSLHHFYEISHPKNQLGSVSVFLDAYDDVAPWPALDKLICQWRRVEEEARSSCGLPPAPPYGRCALFRGQEPTEEWTAEANGELFWYTLPPYGNITDAPTGAPSLFVGEVTSEPTIQATGVPSGAPAAETTTTAPTETLFEATGTGAPTAAAPDSIPWWQSWGQPNDVFPSPTASPSEAAAPAPENSTAIDAGIPPSIDCSAYSASAIARMCSSSQPCCESTRSETSFCWNIYENVFPGSLINSACYHCCDTPKVIGPPADPLPELPKTIQCSQVDSPFRICKPNSCCVSPRSTSSYCTQIYNQFGDDMDQICHYCCAESQTVGPALRRNLRGIEGLDIEAEPFALTGQDSESHISTDVYGRRLVLGKENFEGKNDEHESYEQLMEYQQRRTQEQTMVHEEDYANVEYGTYDWLREVQTEYYFRYEGTQVIPPCWGVVHWRVLKDPTRVHPRQIAELNRLLAWRISTDESNRCEVETAGRLSDDGNTVDLSRETQYYHNLHRKVFCECKDWPSKFEADREWCRNWQQSDERERYFDRPYGFNSNGLF